MFLLKKNNVLAMRIAAPTPITWLEINAAMMDMKGVIYPMEVKRIDDNRFDVIIDTKILPLGELKFDVRVGDVSSKSMHFKIEKGIS